MSIPPLDPHEGELSCQEVKSITRMEKTTPLSIRLRFDCFCPAMQRTKLAISALRDVSFPAALLGLHAEPKSE